MKDLDAAVDSLLSTGTDDYDVFSADLELARGS